MLVSSYTSGSITCTDDVTQTGDEARRVFTDAKRMLRHLIDNKLIEMRAVVGFYRAHSRGDDVILYDVTDKHKKIATLHGLRQQVS